MHVEHWKRESGAARGGALSRARWAAALALSSAIGTGCDASEGAGVRPLEAPIVPGSIGQSAQRLRGPIAEKDLAIALRLDSAAPIVASDRVGGRPLFPEAWYEALLQAYADTAAGGALESENRYEDWRLISLRVAPCSPLGQSLGDSACWPEVRLVWQPVILEVRIHERFADAFADDRAAHALYDVPPEIALSPAAAAEVRSALSRAASGAPLSSRDREALEAGRVAVANALVDAARALRGPGHEASAFDGHGLRPETLGSLDEQAALRSRLLDFLAVFAAPSAIKKLTSFSLPEGREPAHLDEWIFVSLAGANGSVRRENITLHAPEDGRVLHDFGPSMTGTMTRDDESLYDLVTARPGGAIAESVMLWATDLERLAPRIRDRRETLVPNTSCASCHKLNAIRFDLHNFSYLEDRELTVSPRVETDVALDLAWIDAYLR